MSTLGDINVVISATDEASGVIEKVNASLGDLSGAGLERANKSLKTFRDEMGKAEKNITTQKNALKQVETEYNKNTKGLNDNLKALKNNQSRVQNSIVTRQEELEKLKASSVRLDKNSIAFNDNAKAIKWTQTEIDGLQKQHKSIGAEIEKVNKDIQKNSDSVTAARKAVAEAEATYGKFAQKLPEVEAAQKKIDKAMNAEKWVNTGKSMKDVGGAIDDITKPLQFAAAGTLALGVASGKAAMDYETAFTGVRKTVDGTEEQFVALNKGLRNMSETTPVAAKDLANLAAVGGQLGVGIENIEKFTKVIADMNVATNLTGEEGAATLAQFMNVMGEDIDNVDRAGSSIVDLGNHSATTERDIAEMAQRMGSFARSVGIGTPQVLGYAAALASMGVEAQAGGSAIGRTWASIQKAVSSGGESLEAFAKYAGVSAEEFKKQWNTDASGAFNGFIKGLSQSKDLTAALEEVGINNTLDVTAIQLLAKGYDLMTDCLNRSSKAYEENTALTNEANAAYNTVANKLKMAMNAVTNAGIEWGNVLLPEVQKGAEWIGKAGEALGNMSEGQKQVYLGIGKTVLVTGALSKGGAAIVKTIGGVAEGIGTLKAAGAAVSGIAASAPALLPIAAALAIPTATVVGMKLYADHVEEARQNLLHSGSGAVELAEHTTQAASAANELAKKTQRLKEVNDIISSGGTGDEAQAQEQVNAALAEKKELIQWFNDNYGQYLSNLEKEKGITESKAETLNKMTAAERDNRMAELNNKMSEAGSNMPELQKNIAALDNENQRLYEKSTALNNLQAGLRAYKDETLKVMDAEKQGLISKEEYYKQTDAIDKKYGYLTQAYRDAYGSEVANPFVDMGVGLKDADKVINDIGKMISDITDTENGKIAKNSKDIETATASMEEYRQAARIANDLLISELPNAMAQGNQKVQEYISKIGEYGKTVGFGMNEMGSYAQQAALKLNGFSNAEAAAADKNGGMANSVRDCVNIMQQWGASAQQASTQAALLQNGFNSIGQAAAAGKLDVISQQATELAHQLGLIPDNKSISISASGDISILETAEDKIQSIQNDNITVSVNADGDVEVLDKAGNQVQYLEGIGAVSLQVNADGNIDVLNDAGEKIAEIPKEVNTDTEINVNANTDSAKSAINDLNSERVTVTADADVTDADAKIKGLSQTVNITLNYKATGDVPKENAKGTQNFSGGLAMVNDEEGVSDNRELIIDGGRAFIPHGRNVILPLSRGAKVYTARQTKRIMTAMGIPHYAQGKDNSEAFTTAKDDWTHYTKTHAVTITQELEKWVELSEKFKDNQKDIEDIEEEIYSLTVKQNDERNKASEKWADKRIFNNDWEEYGDDIYSAYDRIKVRNMEMVSSGKMTWDDYAEYMESAGEKMYDSRRDQSEKWLEHEKKYNKLSEEDYGAGLQRMREYTLQMYEQGLIDKEKYRQADRELEEKYLDFVSDKNANEYSAWQNDADMWERMRDTYDDWADYNDSKLDFIKRKIEKVEDFYKDGKISFDEYDIATKNYQMDYYNEQSRIYDEKLQEFSSRISKLREKYSDAEQKLQDSWTVSDRKENIEDLQNQIAMYRNATTHAGQEKLKSLESQLKDAQRQQQLYELQQSNNKVLTQMQSQYDYLEENKAAKLRELMKSTVDIAKLEANMSSQIAAAKNALNSDSLRQYNVLRDIYSAIKGLRMGATYTDSRTINNYQGTYNPKGVWSIVNGIAVGGMGSFVF